MTSSNVEMLMSQMESPADSIGIQLGMSEINEANELRSRLDDLQSIFNGFGDGYDQKVWFDLLEGMKQLESQITSFNILHFFYGYMARTALNAQEITDAIIYANAGLALSRSEDDFEGIRSCLMILCDLAVTAGCFTEASKIFEAAHPNLAEAESETYRMLVERSGPNEPEYRFFTDARPESYEFVTTDKGNKESMIRMYMKTMHVSRPTAIKYIKRFSK